MKDKLHRFALKECETSVKDFIKCAEGSGMLMAFQCQDQNQSMNECLQVWTSEESFQKWKKMNDELGDY